MPAMLEKYSRIYLNTKTHVWICCHVHKYLCMSFVDLFRVGGEKVMLLSAAAWGAMTAFTPILAHFCSQPIVSMTVSRFLMGLLQGE